MKRILIYIYFIGSLIGAGHIARGLDYMYFTDSERTSLGEVIRFFSGDTLWGPVRSNDTLHIMQRPVFVGPVITHAWQFTRGIAYNPLFDWILDPIFGAPPLILPENADAMRNAASAQGLLFNLGDNDKALVRLEDARLELVWGTVGVPFDTSEFLEIELPEDAVVFFECPIEVYGLCSTTLQLGAAGEIGLLDNIVYPSWDMTTNRFAEDETARLLLLSEDQILIRNTPANGRENRLEGSDIVIHGYLVALGGSFAFDEQNDVWNPYICDCFPDERGVIYQTGGIVQRNRGYVHRSNNGGTGYLKNYRWDPRMHEWPVPLFQEISVEIFPPVLNFGEVEVGSTATMLLEVVPAQPVLYYIPRPDDEVFAVADDSLLATALWDTTIGAPVTFTPPAEAEYRMGLVVFVEGAMHEITVIGNGVVTNAAEDPPEIPAGFSLAAYPNPFNPTTTLSFTLTKDARVSLDVFDIQGRLVQSLADDLFTAGEHDLQLSAEGLTSGLYFARLQAGTEIATTKLVLLK